eukprot:TRINITY_DN4530_c0_g1_i1.p2 TRINITY_DN4530_c0_g1~~TRINITY_DN4530_c0_g1_i1.p2  ORF type:complete len:165 (-),score=49.88 TRINITY_DN4530_c0_g1_i1:98-592(-)
MCIRDRCNKRWAYTQLGRTNTTICENHQLGSLFATIAAFVKDREDLCEKGQRSCGPNEFNEWMNKNNGWDGANGVNWKVLEKLNIVFVGCTTDRRQIKKWDDERDVKGETILNIDNGNVWVHLETALKDNLSIANPRNSAEGKIEWEDVVKACRFKNNNFGIRK